jgi:formylglycine-generating enzyme required for sulfatase activity
MGRSPEEDRFEIEALERFLSEREGDASGAFDRYASDDDRRREAVARVKRISDGGSTDPDGGRPWSGRAAEPLPGAQFGPFRLLSELGRGGQGVVWLAEDGRLKRKVALKILHRGVASDDDALIRFRREAELASKIDHPGVCSIFEFGRTEGRAWLSSKIADGATAASLLDKRDAAAGLPRRSEVLRWVAIVEKAARAAHAAHVVGVLHRDIKPSNLMVDANDDVVVLDFGLAKDLYSIDSTLTASGLVFGTPGYMAPEQILGVKAAGPETDVFALGAILFRAATGRDLRDEPVPQALRAAAEKPVPSLRKLNRDVPKDVDVVARSALEIDPKCRYRSAAAFADDLRRCLDGDPPAARPVGAITRTLYWAKRRKGVAATAAALLVGLSAGLYFVNEARLRADRLREQSDARLVSIVQLADLRTMRLLTTAAESLAVASPARVAAARAYLSDVADVVSRAPTHAAAREALRRRATSIDPDGAARFSSEDDARLDETLSETLATAEKLKATAAVVRERFEQVESVYARTLEGDGAKAWATCVEAVASSPKYGGLRLRPIFGLLPLGENESTGLWEFWHATSGAMPSEFGPTGAPRPKIGDGLVLVLVPGGTFTPGAIDHDDWALKYETPAGPVTLDAFFIGKYETTQDQWLRLGDGKNPAYHREGVAHGDPGERGSYSPLHPIESISYETAERALSNYLLTLPTEAQWEYACRAGTDSIWWTGDDPESLVAAANCAGLETDAVWRRTKNFEAPSTDPWKGTAPVGSLAPNAFGLYDVHGNVGEFCRDTWTDSYAEAPARPGDGLRDVRTKNDNCCVRGGSHRLDGGAARASCRLRFPRDFLQTQVGVRVARSVAP